MSIRHRHHLALAIAIAATSRNTTGHAQIYQKFEKVEYANTCFANGPHHNIPCCSVDGWERSGSETDHPTCPTLYDIDRVGYSCATNQRLTGVGKAAQRCCSCGPTDMSCAGGLNPDTLLIDSIIPQAYQCDTNSPTPKPEQCDGLNASTVPVDQGCGADEHGCQVGDADPAPIRYSSGRVESHPIELFRITTPGDIFFGYLIKYNSGTNRSAARRETINGVRDEWPAIHQSQQDTHYIGLGWLDNFSDRLQIAAPNKPDTQITWTSQNGTVTFSKVGAFWRSWSGKYELIDRGPSPEDGMGRWVVRTVDSSAPRRIWAFEEFTYKHYNGSANKALGRLRRNAILTSNTSDLMGRYGFTINWSPQGTITDAIDTLGRQILFNYVDETECVEQIPNELPPNNCASIATIATRLGSVQYKPHSMATAATIAALQIENTTHHARLERVARPAMAGYTRFLYSDIPPGSGCNNCGALLTDVIVPGDAAVSTPGPLAPVLATETVLEHDEYGRSPGGSAMVGIYSKAHGREYAYEYTPTKTTQFDLHQDDGPCGAGNSCPSPGFACRTLNQLTRRCYAADVMTHSDATGLPTSHASFGGGGGAQGGSGNAKTFARNYTSTGAPRDAIDASGSRTTYGYDSLARIRCIVDGDNDTQAFGDPSQPDTSACAGSVSSKSVRFDYTTTSVTTTTASVLSPGFVTDVETYDPISLLAVSRVTTGITRDVDGTAYSETHTTTTAHDTLGRVILMNGPLDDSVTYDAVRTEYYTSHDPAWPYNFGQVRTVTQYTGSSSQNTPLTTRYEEYDLFGVAHRINGPNGDQVAYTSSADRLTWTTTQIGSDGATIASSTVVMNANGTVRSSRDGAGVCVTFEYADASGFVGVPTVIRRSDTACGVLPIDQSSGEVEIRTYVKGERDRLESIVRKTNGVTELSYAGFTYDRDRRLISASTLDAATPFVYSFTDVLPSGTTAPEGPSPGSWKTTFTADPLGRPSSLLRFVDATNKQTNGYLYAANTSMRPTTVTRGFNGVPASTSIFSYDDFGRLIAATVPEAGPPGSPATTRYEYDVGSRLVRRRVGVGTPAVNTTAYSYDALDRVTFIDQDVEHPVTCTATTSPAGTPIQDEEYIYDGCPALDSPAGVRCTNALGRLAVALVIVQCGANDNIVKRGRWYGYDTAGRVGSVAYATVTGDTFGAAATITYGYDGAGRPLSYTSPLNDAFGTQYTYGASDGRVASIATTSMPGSPIANNLTYRAFGGLTDFTTASVQPVTGGTRALAVHNGYRQDDALDSLVRGFVGSGDAQSLDVMNASLQRTSSGLLARRLDSADGANSRYYGYDSLQRLTCEVRDGSASDCAVPSARLAGLFVYGNGQFAGSPADARVTSYVNVPGLYTSASLESYSYAAGSPQIQSVTHAGGSIVLLHDAVGRRIADYSMTAGVTDSASRRDYSYLPNGQLGTVEGETPGHEPYLVTMRYDTEGRPITLSRSSGPAEAHHELFWDDANRLIAASILSPDGTHDVRWHYHYFGDVLIAATRELSGGATSMKRFWVVSDERNLIARMVDEQGATYWQASWDATGVRSLIGDPQPDMWVPFGLPGQLILEGTEAAGASGTATRPPIALNRLRAYDPLLGSFLQPDPADQTGRLLPEGYIYGRGNYVGRVDVSGAYSEELEALNRQIPQRWRKSFDDSCKMFSPDVYKILNDSNLVDKIAADIDNCKNGKCGDDVFAGKNIKRQWKVAMLSGRYFCANSNVPTDWHGAQWVVDSDGKPLSNREFDTEDWARTITPQQRLGRRQTLVGEQPKDGCWARMIAHEALHGVLSSIPISQVTVVGQGPGGLKPWSSELRNFGHSVIMGDDGLEMCIRCN
jgi:RHS repeat-associated protein